MCTGLEVALIAGTVASGVSSYVGQQQAAKAQEAANMQARDLAIQNQNLQIRALNNREEEDAKRAEEALRQNALAADATRATAAVAAGESGVSGLSVDALLGDITRQEVQNKQDVLQTQDFGQRQRQLDREGLGITAQSQINQLPLVEYPSFFDTAVGTATAAYGTYSDSQFRKKQLDSLK